MEFAQILFFMKVAELEHMTRAAEELNISQPYLSSTISDLEADLGVKLFDRVGRGIRLNQFGEIVYRYGTRLVCAEKDLRHELLDVQEKERNQLIIATNASMYMPGLLAEAKRCMPKTKIHLHHLKQRNLCRQLALGTIDFAIIGPRAFPEFESEQLIREGGIIVHPMDHWLKDYDKIALKDLTDEAFISTRKGYAMADVFESYFPTCNIQMKTQIETTDTTSALQFVKAGIGIAMAAKSLLKLDPYFKDCYVEVSDFQLHGTTYLMWRKGQYLDSVARQFMQVTRNFFKQLKE